MYPIQLTFIDKIGDGRIREHLIKCETDPNDINLLLSKINGNKWRNVVDFNEIKKKVRYFQGCELVKTKETVIGGFTGGPIGMRKFIYPAVYEYPSNAKTIKTKTSLRCSQEGSHLNCSLDPEIL